VGRFRPDFHVEGDVHTNHFCVDRPVNAFVMWLAVFIQRNFEADFL